nr:tetratricopeptide repeat protein [Mangrovivirga halotolerans]
MEYYNTGDYEKAVETLSAFTDENPQSDMAKIYLGISFMETGQNNKAISVFHELKSNANGLPKELSEWYLAMVYLKTDNVDESRKLLNSIHESDHIYSGKAKKLLSQLK